MTVETLGRSSPLERLTEGFASLPETVRVRRVLLLTKDLDPDDAEITRTRKVRRRYIADKYATVVEALYTGQTEVALTTAVTYEDGRQGTVQSRVRIADVDGGPAHG